MINFSKYNFQYPNGEYDNLHSPYRFGFNGQELDNEIQGSGNSYDFGARIFDSRLGRWLSLDPLMTKYPNLSPYCFAANSPLIFVDPDGKDIVPTDEFNKSPYKPIFDKIQSNSVYQMLTINYQMPSKKNMNLGYKSFNVIYKDDPKLIDANAVITANLLYPADVAGYQCDIMFNSDKFTAVEYSWSGETPYTVKGERTDIGMARTILHELVHDYLYNGNNPENKIQHEIMATDKYRNLIIEGLKEYATANDLKFSQEDFEVLSWGGLEKTKAFKEKFDTEEKYNEWSKKFLELEVKTTLEVDKKD